MQAALYNKQVSELSYMFLQKASVTHYRAFIEVAKGLGATQESLKHADSKLDALLADLPALSAACEHFAQSTAVFTAKRAESKQLLSASALSESCMHRQTCRDTHIFGCA